MFRTCAFGFLVALAVTGVPASASDGAQSPGDKKQKIICKSDTVTGSRLKKKRICMTAGEWDELAARTKKGLDEFNRGAAGGANSSWDPSKGPG